MELARDDFNWPRVELVGKLGHGNLKRSILRFLINYWDFRAGRLCSHCPPISAFISLTQYIQLPSTTVQHKVTLTPEVGRAAWPDGDGARTHNLAQYSTGQPVRAPRTTRPPDPPFLDFLCPTSSIMAVPNEIGCTTAVDQKWCCSI